MPLRKSLLVLVALLLTFAVLPVRAQDGEGLSDDEKALLEIVATAQQNFIALNSYTFTGEQVIDQTIVSGVGINALNLQQTLTQNVDGQAVKSGEMLNSQHTFTQQARVVISGSIDPINLAMNMEFVVVDGQIYVRFTRLPDPELVDTSSYPQDWVNLSETNIAGLEELNLEGLAALASTPVTYLFNEETVLAIEEIEAEDADGSRVFSMTIDATAALGDSLTTLIDFDSANADFLPLFLESVTATVTVYVNGDNVMHRVVSTVVIDFEAEAGVVGPDAISIDQTTTATFDFAGFDSAIEITVPQPEGADDSAADSVDESSASDAEDDSAE